MDLEGSSTSNLYYAEYQTGVLGKIWLAASETGLKYLSFEEETGDFLAHLVTSIESETQPNILYDPVKLALFLKAIEAYCHDKTPIPADLKLDLTDMTEFQQNILDQIRAIPFGAVTTYGEIADSIQNPNASRAIGQVLRRNPIPIIIPCHRVLSADGTLGGYGGVMGSERKITLLKHEGIILA